MGQILNCLVPCCRTKGAIHTTLHRLERSCKDKEESVPLAHCSKRLWSTYKRNWHSSLPPPFDFNSTRKQNYMMNFSRQHGLRHFYNRRRRSLRRYPWRNETLIFSSQHVMCCFPFFKSSTASGIRTFLQLAWWITESLSQDRVYATFSHCELMRSDLFSHR